MEGELGKVDSGTQCGTAEVKGGTSSGEGRELTVAFGGKGEGQGAQGGSQQGMGARGRVAEASSTSLSSARPFPSTYFPLTSRNVIFVWDQETGEPNGSAV